MEMICTICARGGSKGVKNKNLKLLSGIPLLAYSIRQARDSGLFSLIAVSSDSADILQVAKEHGADYAIERPDELATDTAAKVPAIQHCVREAEKRSGKTFDICVDLDATSPLRMPQDIRNAVELLAKKGATNVLTAMPARRSPYFNLVEVDEKGIVRLSKTPPATVVRRQDVPRAYDLNASIYVWKRECLFNSGSVFQEGTVLYEMPEERSIDIDSELDFELVKLIMENRKNAKN